MTVWAAGGYSSHSSSLQVAHLDSWGLNPGFKATLDTHLSSTEPFQVLLLTCAKGSVPVS